jgi:hypothetical protein
MPAGVSLLTHDRAVHAGHEQRVLMVADLDNLVLLIHYLHRLAQVLKECMRLGTTIIDNIKTPLIDFLSRVVSGTK